MEKFESSDPIIKSVIKIENAIKVVQSDIDTLFKDIGGGNNGIQPLPIAVENRKRLLDKIWFGDEINSIEVGAKNFNYKSLQLLVPEISKFTEDDWHLLDEIIRTFFPHRQSGWYGGPITAGDAWFIAVYMMALRPKIMLEVGVCSGVSSAFILHAARHLSLLADNEVFLHSVDFETVSSIGGNEIGRVVGMNIPELKPYWKLNTGCTLPMYLASQENRAIFSGGSVLSLIDANHSHPWPVVDLLSIASVVSKNSWVLLQDTQVMERWMFDTIMWGMPCFGLCRGVNIAVNGWQGNKVIGFGMCYNMAALQLDQSKEAMSRYKDVMMSYFSEVDDESYMKSKEIVDGLFC